jgi:hypothetical protein
MQERQDILIGNRVSKRLHAKIVAEQKRLKKETGLEPSLNEVVRLLIEKGLAASEEQRSR